MRIDQRFEVAYNYPVHFIRGVLNADDSLLADTLDRFGEGRRHFVAVYVDEDLSRVQPRLIPPVNDDFHPRSDRFELAAPLIVTAGGPCAKSDWSLGKEIMWTLGNLHLDRQSVGKLLRQ